jgi:hypothetical protein
MKEYMYEANEKFYENILHTVCNGGMFVWPDALAVFRVIMKRLVPVDERSYRIIKDTVRPEWFNDHVCNPNFVTMN